MNEKNINIPPDLIEIIRENLEQDIRLLFWANNWEEYVKESKNSYDKMRPKQKEWFHFKEPDRARELLGMAYRLEKYAKQIRLLYFGYWLEGSNYEDN